MCTNSFQTMPYQSPTHQTKPYQAKPKLDMSLAHFSPGFFKKKFSEGFTPGFDWIPKNKCIHYYMNYLLFYTQLVNWMEIV